MRYMQVDNDILLKVTLWRKKHSADKETHIADAETHIADTKTHIACQY